jgi:hypothetical protein
MLSDAMTIKPFLEGRRFDPETVKVMGIAYENARKALGLGSKDDFRTRIVARTVIEVTHRGIRDADQLTAAVLREFDQRQAPTTVNQPANSEPPPPTVKQNQEPAADNRGGSREP